MPNDMHATIVPKSDQLNADDLIGREMTVTITGVNIRGGQEQPVAISFDGDNGKPYKACKSMCRVMVTAWGADSSKYVGRSMTLYRDPTVKWGGMEVGGIRISHMSDIDKPMTLALTMTKSNRKPYTVKPLVGQPKAAAPQAPPSDSAVKNGGLMEQTIEPTVWDLVDAERNRAPKTIQARFDVKMKNYPIIHDMPKTVAENALLWLKQECNRSATEEQ